VFAPFENCRSAETSKHASNNKSRSVYRSLLANARNSRKSSRASLVSLVAKQRRGKHISAAVSRHATTAAAWDVFYSVGANQEYNGVFCVVGAEAT
jgi:hypothetical protein